MTLEEIILENIKHIDGLTEEEWEKGFEGMGGRKIETAMGTLLMIEHKLSNGEVKVK